MCAASVAASCQSKGNGQVVIRDLLFFPKEDVIQIHSDFIYLNSMVGRRCNRLLYTCYIFMRNKQSKRGLTRLALTNFALLYLSLRTLRLQVGRTQHNKQDAVKTIYLLVLGSYKTELACTIVCLITYQENRLPTYAILIPQSVYNLVQLNLSKTFYVLRLVAPI